MWALVKPHNQEVFRTDRKKYNLLKQLETKERVSKKNVSSFQDGDAITVVFRKNYQKWFYDDDLNRSIQKEVEEVEQAVYILKKIPFNIR